MKAFIVWAVTCCAVCAGQIEMVDGTKFDGEIIKEIPAQLQIRTEHGVITLPADKVKRPPVLTPSPAASVAPSGKLKIDDFGASIVETRGNYVHAAWKIKMTNGTASPMKVNLFFRFLDDQDFELEKESEYGVTFPSGETKTITGKTMIPIAVWNRVKSYQASTEAAP